MEDVKVKTRTGALCRSLFERCEIGMRTEQVFPHYKVTLIASAIILTFTSIEFFDYRRVNVDTSLIVDKSRGERLTVKMNVTFPRVPCYRK